MVSDSGSGGPRLGARLSFILVPNPDNRPGIGFHIARGANLDRTRKRAAAGMTAAHYSLTPPGNMGVTGTGCPARQTNCSLCDPFPARVKNFASEFILWNRKGSANSSAGVDEELLLGTLAERNQERGDLRVCTYHPANIGCSREVSRETRGAAR
jgi:hypothetical protein